MIQEFDRRDVQAIAEGIRQTDRAVIVEVEIFGDIESSIAQIILDRFIHDRIHRVQSQLTKCVRIQKRFHRRSRLSRSQTRIYLACFRIGPISTQIHRDDLPRRIQHHHTTIMDIVLLSLRTRRTQHSIYLGHDL